ncbi:MAG: hypothetical protein O2856_12135 [Planctomycetota bacterium]|nr:hypothetical protein [Planctomycetota bacterium]
MVSRLGIAAEQSVTPEVARIISDPIQQIEFQRLRDRYFELLRKIDELRDAMAEAEVKYGESHPKVIPLIRSRDRAEKESAAVRESMMQMLAEASLVLREKARKEATSPTTSSVQPL